MTTRLDEIRKRFYYPRYIVTHLRAWAHPLPQTSGLADHVFLEITTKDMYSEEGVFSTLRLDWGKEGLWGKWFSSQSTMQQDESWMETSHIWFEFFTLRLNKNDEKYDTLRRRTVFVETVLDMCELRSGSPYSVLWNNCQHFVYALQDAVRVMADCQNVTFYQQHDTLIDSLSYLRFVRLLSDRKAPGKEPIRVWDCALLCFAGEVTEQDLRLVESCSKDDRPYAVICTKTHAHEDTCQVESAIDASNVIQKVQIRVYHTARDQKAISRCISMSLLKEMSVALIYDDENGKRFLSALKERVPCLLQRIGWDRRQPFQQDLDLSSSLTLSLSELESPFGQVSQSLLNADLVILVSNDQEAKDTISVARQRLRKRTLAIKTVDVADRLARIRWGDKKHKWSQQELEIERSTLGLLCGKLELENLMLMHPPTREVLWERMEQFKALGLQNSAESLTYYADTYESAISKCVTVLRKDIRTVAMISDGRYWSNQNVLKILQSDVSKLIDCADGKHEASWRPTEKNFVSAIIDRLIDGFQGAMLGKLEDASCLMTADLVVLLTDDRRVLELVTKLRRATRKRTIAILRENLEDWEIERSECFASPLSVRLSRKEQHPPEDHLTNAEGRTINLVYGTLDLQVTREQLQGVKEVEPMLRDGGVRSGESRDGRVLSGESRGLENAPAISEPSSRIEMLAMRLFYPIYSASLQLLVTSVLGDNDFSKAINKGVQAGMEEDLQ